jgi:hypothetical protein
MYKNITYFLLSSAVVLSGDNISG